MKLNKRVRRIIAVNMDEIWVMWQLVGRNTNYTMVYHQDWHVAYNFGLA